MKKLQKYVSERLIPHPSLSILTHGDAQCRRRELHIYELQVLTEAVDNDTNVSRGVKRHWRAMEKRIVQHGAHMMLIDLIRTETRF
jgi:hypothetical protein